MPDRQFATDAPGVRIWAAGGATVERTIIFDAAANGYHVDYYNWDREDDAPTTVTESRKRYPHVAGHLLRAVISFNIWKPGMGPVSGRADATAVAGFTELDLEVLDNALAAGQDVEFYLHGSAIPTAKSSIRLVEHRVTDSKRGDGNWIHQFTIEFNGLNLSATRPAEL